MGMRGACLLVGLGACLVGAVQIDLGHDPVATARMEKAKETAVVWAPIKMGNHEPNVAPVMEVSPDTIDKEYQLVNISWYNVSHVKKGDYIALFASDQDIHESAPIAFTYCAPYGVWPGKDGWATMGLTNRGVDYKFVYVSGTTQYPEAKVVSGKVTFTNKHVPFGVRLNLGKNPGEMAVTWTQNGMGPSVAGQVTYWTGNEKPVTVETTYVQSFTQKDMCDQATQPAGVQGYINTGNFYTAVMKGIKPGVQYKYYVHLSSGGYPSSSTFTFTGPPTPNAALTTLFMFGDMGQAPIDGTSFQHSWDFHNRGEYPSLNTTRLLERLYKEGDLVAHIGDISYAVGYLSEWAQWSEQVQPVSAHIPWQAGIGNHEEGWSGSFFGPGSDSGGECGVLYNAHFPLASQNPSSSFKERQPWYSFQHGPAHIVVTSTEHNFTQGSPQHMWVEQDLASVDRQTYPWLIFTGHRPVYPDSKWSGDETVSEMLVDAYEALWFKYNVDMTMWGHQHVYSRTCKMKDKKCVGWGEPGPFHVVVGSAGYELGHTLNKSDPPPYILYAQEQYYGILKLDLTRTTLKGYLYPTNTTSFIDSFEVIKSSNNTGILQP